jgi:hypothetical protein
MNESKFSIEVAKRRKVIKLRGTKAPRTRNPANRENCTLIECISTSSRVLNPLIILKGKVITTDFAANLLDDYMLGVLDSSWTNNDHSVTAPAQARHVTSQLLKISSSSGSTLLSSLALDSYI